MQNQQKNPQQILHGNHPSGITDEGELAYVSMEFWVNSDGGEDSILDASDEKFNRLLSFQQGWVAAKKYYKVVR